MTKYPDSLDNGLMARLKQEFTTEEQGLFLQSFSTHLNYNQSDLVIDLDEVWEWMGFTNKCNAKTALLKNFKEEAGEFKSASCQHKALSGVPRNGGQNRKLFTMSVSTFKELFMFSKTEKARKVRKYYLKMEEVMMEYLKDRDMHRILELTTAKTLAVNDREAAISAAFLSKLGSRNALYMGKMETLGPNDFVFKVGSSKDIVERGRNIKPVFGSTPTFLEVIVTDMNEELERWVFSQPFFLDRQYTGAVNGKHRSVECFRGSMADFEVVRDLIKKKSITLGTISRMTALELAQQKNEETRLRVQEMEMTMKDRQEEATKRKWHSARLSKWPLRFTTTPRQGCRWIRWTSTSKTRVYAGLRCSAVCSPTHRPSTQIQSGKIWPTLSRR
jgi:phage anti-repressor protein